jgi:stage V sporulation protein AE
VVTVEVIVDLLKAFAVGGSICLIGQLLIDLTKLTPGRILVAFVVIGVFLTAIGVYEPIVEFAGAGATVPLTGFGYSLANGVKEAIAQYGLIGVLSGGLTATAAGIAASVFFGFIMALIFKPHDKN